MTLSHCRHASQTGQACTTRERQQQSLHLVISMLSQGHVFDLSTPIVLQRLSQRSVTGLTSCIFWALTDCVSGVDPLHHQWHVQAFT
jgi:hypothetical protein